MNNILVSEGLLTLNVLLHDIDIVDRNIIGELAEQSVQRHETTGRQVRYNNYKNHVSNHIAFFRGHKHNNPDKETCRDNCIHSLKQS